MENSPEKSSKYERVPQAWVMFDEPGHEKEYVLILEGNWGPEKFIPWEIESELSKELGEEWDVSDRGTRIEIVNKKNYGIRDDQKVHSAIKKVLTSHGYQLKE